MKNVFFAIIAALVMTGCAAAPNISPGVTPAHMEEAYAICDKHQGVRMVTQSLLGFYAFCDDGEAFKL